MAVCVSVVLRLPEPRASCKTLDTQLPVSQLKRTVCSKCCKRQSFNDRVTAVHLTWKPFTQFQLQNFCRTAIPDKKLFVHSGSVFWDVMPSSLLYPTGENSFRICKTHSVPCFALTCNRKTKHCRETRGPHFYNYSVGWWDK
jgi:hypothetical protein